MDSRIPLHGGAILPAERRKTLATGATRKTRGVNAACTPKTQRKTANIRRAFDRLIDTCLERFRKKKESDKSKGLDDASDDDVLASNDVTASLPSLPAKAEPPRVNSETDARRKQYERNVRIGTTWREMVDDRMTTQEKIERVPKTKDNKMTKKKKKKRKKNIVKGKETNDDDDGEADGDETTERTAPKTLPEIETGSYIDGGIQRPSFHFNDKMLAAMIVQNMTKNNIFINSRSDQMPEGSLRRKGKRPKRPAGRRGNLDRLVVKTDVRHDDSVTRIYLRHSPQRDTAEYYLETQIRTLPGAHCPSSFDLRIVSSHGTGCAAVLDAAFPVLTFRVEGVRRRRRHDVNPDVMTSRHYWQRHRHRHRNQRRAMNKVADWIDTELTGECRGFRSPQQCG